MSEMITVTIDGRQCTCEKGEYIFDVARRNGIFIPVLCRSDAFADHRACCRICLVEVVIRGRSKVVTSCIYPIEEECEIFTTNDKIKEERAVVISLLAHRAPGSPRIAQMSKWLKGDGIDRFVSVDGEKCILCGLCVQACDSIGTGAISTVNRGVSKIVDTPYGKSSPDCVGCLSCANVCPTEAIGFSQDDTTRTIWNHTFDLVFCRECGAVLGTREQVDWVARSEAARDGDPGICDACRKRVIASSLMKTNRNI